MDNTYHKSHISWFVRKKGPYTKMIVVFGIVAVNCYKVTENLLKKLLRIYPKIWLTTIGCTGCSEAECHFLDGWKWPKNKMYIKNQGYFIKKTVHHFIL